MDYFNGARGGSEYQNIRMAYVCMYVLYCIVCYLYVYVYVYVYIYMCMYMYMYMYIWHTQLYPLAVRLAQFPSISCLDAEYTQMITNSLSGNSQISWTSATRPGLFDSATSQSARTKPHSQALNRLYPPCERQAHFFPNRPWQQNHYRTSQGLRLGPQTCCRVMQRDLTQLIAEIGR